MNTIKNISQGSPEWHQLRLGKVTASRIKEVMTNGRGGLPSKTSESYMIELISELLTGTKKASFENDAMRWGVETEPQARAMYELSSGVEVEEVAFVEHSEFIGVSPDGLVGSDGLLEIKCPSTATQIKRALSRPYHSDYTAQIQAQIWVCQRDWCDFVSFDPRLDVSASYLVERVFRDDDYISKMKEKTYEFIDRMRETLETLRCGDDNA